MHTQERVLCAVASLSQDLGQALIRFGTELASKHDSVPLAEAAKQIGLTPEGLRKRLHKMAVPVERKAGKIYVSLSQVGDAKNG